MHCPKQHHSILGVEEQKMCTFLSRAIQRILNLRDLRRFRHIHAFSDMLSICSVKVHALVLYRDAYETLFRLKPNLPCRTEDGEPEQVF